MYSSESIERIHKYNPNIRLIDVQHDPMTRAYLRWNMRSVETSESVLLARTEKPGLDN